MLVVTAGVSRLFSKGCSLSVRKVVRAVPNSGTLPSANREVLQIHNYKPKPTAQMLPRSMECASEIYDSKEPVHPHKLGVA